MLAGLSHDNRPGVGSKTFRSQPRDQQRLHPAQVVFFSERRYLLHPRV